MSPGPDITPDKKSATRRGYQRNGPCSKARRNSSRPDCQREICRGENAARKDAAECPCQVGADPQSCRSSRAAQESGSREIAGVIADALQAHETISVRFFSRRECSNGGGFGGHAEIGPARSSLRRLPRQ